MQCWPALAVREANHKRASAKTAARFWIKMKIWNESLIGRANVRAGVWSSAWGQLLANFRVALAAAVLAAVAGCSTGPNSTGSSTGAVKATATAKQGKNLDGVTQVHLLTTPMALNLDNAPGPDGFGEIGRAHV